MFTKNKNIKIKREIDSKMNLYYLYLYCIGCNFKKLETIDKEEVSYLLDGLIIRQCSLNV